MYHFVSFSITPNFSSTKSSCFTCRICELFQNYRLDRFWSNQEIIYDFRAELDGTGSRSEVLVNIIYTVVWLVIIIYCTVDAA